MIWLVGDISFSLKNISSLVSLVDSPLTKTRRPSYRKEDYKDCFEELTRKDITRVVKSIHSKAYKSVNLSRAVLCFRL